jgi:hypothetical protein
MGIIRNLKVYYRKKIVQHIITQIDTNADVTASQLAKTVTLLDSMHMLKVAWKDVKQTTIVNCFRKAGFSLTTVDEPTSDNPSSETPGLTESEFDDYVNIDATVECHGTLTDQDIVDSVRHQDQDDSDSEDSPTETVRAAETHQALKTVRAYLEQHGRSLTNFYTLEKDVYQTVNQASRQCNITDFFKH